MVRPTASDSSSPPLLVWEPQVEYPLHPSTPDPPGSGWSAPGSCREWPSVPVQGGQGWIGASPTKNNVLAPYRPERLPGVVGWKCRCVMKAAPLVLVHQHQRRATHGGDTRQDSTLQLVPGGGEGAHRARPCLSVPKRDQCARRSYEQAVYEAAGSQAAHGPRCAGSLQLGRAR